MTDALHAARWQKTLPIMAGPFLKPIVQAVMYKRQRALQSCSNDENRIGKYGGSVKRAGSGFKAVCDRIVPRSENDDHHDRFALHRVNKLRGLRYRSPADSRRLHHKLFLIDNLHANRTGLVFKRTPEKGVCSHIRSIIYLIAPMSQAVGAGSDPLILR
jgi:hypothetical protein